MDLIIATYVWNDRRHAYLYVLMAGAGSAVGGLIPFLLGRAGGELFLLRRIDRSKYEAMMARFEKQEFLAMAHPLRHAAAHALEGLCLWRRRL